MMIAEHHLRIWREYMHWSSYPYSRCFHRHILHQGTVDGSHSRKLHPDRSGHIRPRIPSYRHHIFPLLCRGTYLHTRCIRRSFCSSRYWMYFHHHTLRGYEDEGPYAGVYEGSSDRILGIQSRQRNMPICNCCQPRIHHYFRSLRHRIHLCPFGCTHLRIVRYDN